VAGGAGPDDWTAFREHKISLLACRSPAEGLVYCALGKDADRPETAVRVTLETLFGEKNQVV